jgi:DUF1680 family protein
VTKMADYFQGRLAALPAATIEKTFRTDGSGNPQNEFGAMSDVLAELSAVTGQKKYLETAKIFNRSWFITPLASGQDNLSGLHGNCHIAQALGIAHTANLSGDTASLQASENFWKLLTGKHAFVIGGDSFHEWLDKPGVEAGASIDGQKVLPPTTAETCNTHNMLKLTSVLFERSPRIDYADYYERALYNHILASIAPDTGNVVYFTPLYGNFRTYVNGTFCDNGTGIENTPRYNEGIYFQQGSSLWINLYIPSELTWDATGLTLQQKGNAAAGEQVSITIVKGGDATQATLNLRIPSWVSGSATVTVNGTAQTPPATASTYVSVSRQWKVGDVVTLTLPARSALSMPRTYRRWSRCSSVPCCLPASSAAQTCRTISRTRTHTSAPRRSLFRPLPTAQPIQPTGLPLLPAPLWRTRCKTLDPPQGPHSGRSTISTTSATLFIGPGPQSEVNLSRS